LEKLAMKKTLIALATLAATSAFAQSTVTISGNVDVGLTSSTFNDVKLSTMHSGLASTSKLIIQGTEDLGGGLKATFYTETGLAATTHLGTGVNNTTAGATNYLNSEKTSTAIGDRGIFLGLTGAFGTVNAGRIPHQTGAFAIGMGGVQNAFSNAVGAGAAHPGQNSDVLLISQSEGRANNSFLYTSPSFSGLTAKVQKSLGGGNGDGSQGDRTTLAANYTNGPVAVEVMSSKKNAYDASSATATGATPAQTGSYSAYAAGSEIKETAAGAKYDLGVVALGVGYAKQTVGTAAASKATGLGATVPLGAVTLAAGWAKMTPATGAAYNATSLSAQYAFSKRTSAYAAMRSNNQAAGKDKLTVVGLNHSF
jgi:predicted porin